MTLYNTIGQSYNDTRRADARIIDALVAHLGLPTGSTIADIGAGTGNYANALADRGYVVAAVEPSDRMRSQVTSHLKVRWHSGGAEEIPLAGASVNGVISTLAIHHFKDLRKALREMHRIAPTGPFVFFTFDYHDLPNWWVADYFPKMWADAVSSLPPLSSIAAMIAEETGRRSEIFTFPLPHDLTDLFMAAAWRRPELYLRPEIQAGISSFQLGDQGEIESGVARLEADLTGGTWEAQYGHVLALDVLDVGYRFLRALPAGT